MEIDTDKLMISAIKDGISSAVKTRLETYSSPLGETLNACIKKHEPSIHAIISDAISACVNDAEFKAEIVASTRTQLARTLVQRIGGELEKQVNALKADPTTRARITMAIDAIVKDSNAHSGD